VYARLDKRRDEMAIEATPTPSIGPCDGGFFIRDCGDSARAISNSGDECRLFDPSSNLDWLVLIRDVAAIANSGGGELAIRFVSDGQGADKAGAVSLGLTSHDFLNRLAQFSDSEFADLQIRKHDSNASEVVMAVGRAQFPIVFNKDAYEMEAANPLRRVEVFHAGSFYTRRHGRTVPGTTDDIRVMFERFLRQVRRGWVRGIRRVMQQPLGSVRPMRSDRKSKRDKLSKIPPVLQPVRIVTDPSAPALQPQDVDRLYPLRQKDLLHELNDRLGRRALNSYDIQAVRRQHRLDEHPDFVFHLPGAGRRYSPVVIDWILKQREHNPKFFDEARAADHELMKLRRQKPK
jgi:hypothetical protein